ncbi:ECF subfamily RNA polymerase sigma-24 subunit [Cupriavidus basilensis OR16]|uniref:ECF subfamily RNA polymerase sigma-24 subunit n=1 Tax=Cupriavidus basilensis OR16 TaxID=1127483 RepID=H1S064_9BURK|nr:RNA polymerase sigma factor [Cupriavidus basilensis]EHP44000.1 ECF subfamily RNA polymerase sigma-24 subunit [Cupriavidus basilensis OR16]
MSDKDPDDVLLARVGRHDAAAVREMVSRKLPRVLALATRMLGDRGEAEDVAQEVFMRLWREAARWQPGRARFDTWLHRVALNLCYDRLRGTQEQAIEAMPEQAAPGAGPEEALDVAAQGARVGAALAKLPARQREALVLQYYQELPNGEAAALMGISIEALESLLARARRNLRDLLMQDGHHEDLR